MALSLKDPQTDTLARQVAKLTGESLTVAVRTALSERLERVKLKRGRPTDKFTRLQEITKRSSALPVFDTRTDEEIMGWDENGLPT